ncbi:MAG TPA: hypothetical protein ENH19_00130 [Actinobacteria bacterium]|nr:hypothetical protein [Actinomycetes bacterium]HEX21043.1 hypothetical protein [Actinomycetota bacterium]
MKKIILTLITVIFIILMASSAAMAITEANLFFAAMPANAQNKDIVKTAKEVEALRTAIIRKRIELRTVNHNMEKSSREIIFIYQKLTDAQNKLKKQREITNRRIREIYENSYNNKFIVYMLASNHLSDFWKRILFLNRVNQLDRRLLAKNKIYLDRVKHYKKEIADRKQAQVDTRQNITEQLIDMRRDYETKQFYLVALRLETKSHEQQRHVSNISLNSTDNL